MQILVAYVLQCQLGLIFFSLIYYPKLYFCSHLTYYLLINHTSRLLRFEGQEHVYYLCALTYLHTIYSLASNLKKTDITNSKQLTRKTSIGENPFLCDICWYCKHIIHIILPSILINVSWRIDFT